MCIEFINLFNMFKYVYITFIVLVLLIMCYANNILDTLNYMN